MKDCQAKEALRLARKRAILTAREAAQQRIHSQVLTRLVREGAVERISRGQYRIPGQALTEHHTLAIVSRAAPEAVICLLSALSFHGIGTQVPHEVWLAIPRHARVPGLSYPPLRVVKFSGKAFSEGIETHTAEGQAVRVYGVAKTMADVFKYRNKVGLDVAMEALRVLWDTQNRPPVDRSKPATEVGGIWHTSSRDRWRCRWETTLGWLTDRGFWRYSSLAGATVA